MPIIYINIFLPFCHKTNKKKKIEQGTQERQDEAYHNVDCSQASSSSTLPLLANLNYYNLLCFGAFILFKSSLNLHHFIVDKNNG